MQLKRVAEAKLPTPWGDFLMVGFEELATGQDHVALVYGDISGQSPGAGHALAAGSHCRHADLLAVGHGGLLVDAAPVRAALAAGRRGAGY